MELVFEHHVISGSAQNSVFFSMEKYSSLISHSLVPRTRHAPVGEEARDRGGEARDAHDDQSSDLDAAGLAGRERDRVLHRADAIVLDIVAVSRPEQVAVVVSVERAGARQKGRTRDLFGIRERAVAGGKTRAVGAVEFVLDALQSILSFAATYCAPAMRHALPPVGGVASASYHSMVP